MRMEATMHDPRIEEELLDSDDEEYELEYEDREFDAEGGRIPSMHNKDRLGASTSASCSGCSASS